MKPNRIAGAVIATAVTLGGAAAEAGEITVKMLNRGEAGAMVFEPEFIRAEVGDTVRFVPTDKGHNAETIKGFLPDGAEPFTGKINEEIVVELTEEGLYGIRCKPHFGLGMVALIQAGAPVNLDEVRDVTGPKRVKAKFADWFGRL